MEIEHKDENMLEYGFGTNEGTRIKNEDRVAIHIIEV